MNTTGERLGGEWEISVTDTCRGPLGLYGFSESVNLTEGGNAGISSDNTSGSLAASGGDRWTGWLHIERPLHPPFRGMLAVMATSDEESGTPNRLNGGLVGHFEGQKGAVLATVEFRRRTVTATEA